MRYIDWNVTARMREPHVRVHVGERALTAWLMLDVSPSMTFGTTLRRKADVAEGVALAVGHVATRRGNRLGVVAFGGPEPRVLRPRQGRLGLLGLLAELRADPPPTAPARRRSARRASGWRRSPARAGWSSSCPTSAARATGRRGCGALRARHGVLAVEIRDPRELELPPVGDVWMVDPETGRQIVVNTSRRRVRGASRPPRRPSARRSRPRCAAPAPTTSSSPRTATGCATSRATCAAPSRCATARWRPAGPAARRRRRTRSPVASPRGRGRARGRDPPPQPAAPAPEGRDVSFREPAVLLGLALLPVALLAYVAMQHGAAREAAAFGNPALMPNLVTAGRAGAGTCPRRCSCSPSPP